MPTAAHSISLVGHLGGAPVAYSVQGTYAYVGFGPELAVLDVADPRHSVRVGYIVLPYQLADLYVVGSRAYLVDTPDDYEERGFLHIVDIADPRIPQLLGSYELNVSPNVVVVADNRAYVANGWNGLHIFDVHDPTMIRLLAHYELEGGAMGIAVAGTRAYVDSEEAGLIVLDVEDPEHPIAIGTEPQALNTDPLLEAETLEIGTTVPYAPSSLEAVGKISFVHQTSGLDLVEQTDAGDFIKVGMYRIPSSAWSVQVSEGYAYIFSWDEGRGGGFHVVDVRLPQNPVEIYAEPLQEVNSAEITVLERWLYLNTNQGVYLFDIADPIRPARYDWYPMPNVARDVVVVADSAYVLAGNYRPDGIAEFSIVARTPALEVDKLNTSYESERQAGGRSDIGYAAIAQYDGLHILELCAPDHCAEVSRYAAPAVAATVQGSYAYLIGNYDPAGNPTGLQIIDISNPAIPILVGQCSTPRVPTAIAVNGTFAYVTDRAFENPGLRVIDISDPANPQDVVHYVTSEQSVAVATDGAYIYMAGASDGLFILRHSVPSPDLS